MPKIKLLIVDDQYLFAESLQTVLTTRFSRFTVCGIVENGLQAVEWVKNHSFDVILMDVRMPVMDGVEAARAIRAEFPRSRILMLTTFKDDNYVYQALKNGAIGYVLKNTPVEDLAAAIEAAHHGVVQFSPDLLPNLVSRCRPEERESEENADFKRPEWIAFLSPREKEILQLMAEGLSNPDIARRLFIAPQTVKNHVSQIYGKVGAKDRMEAVRLVQHLKKDLRLL